MALPRWWSSRRSSRTYVPSSSNSRRMVCVLLCAVHGASAIHTLNVTSTCCAGACRSGFCPATGGAVLWSPRPDVEQSRVPSYGGSSRAEVCAGGQAEHGRPCQKSPCFAGPVTGNRCAQDKSWRVRYNVAQQLYMMCVALGPEASRWGAWTSSGVFVMMQKA